jgi:hypothetical protein
MRGGKTLVAREAVGPVSGEAATALAPQSAGDAGKQRLATCSRSVGDVVRPK